MPRVPIEIMDGDDPRVEVFRDVRDRDLRGREGLFMAESALVLRRLLRRPCRLHAVLLSRTRHRELAGALEALPADVPVYVAEVDVISRIAGFHVHRGVLAAGRRPSADETRIDAALAPLRSRPCLTLIAAEGIVNVDNLGGLFRNAAAFGVDGVVLDPTCCDPLYRKAIRVSMGHVFAVPWAVSRDWSADLDRFRESWGMTLVGAESDGDARPLWEIPLAARLLLLLGSEHDGLGAASRAACDVVCRVPMAPGVPSLNVVNACAVFLYERRRGWDGQIRTAGA
jgi:tRNA G18 (ribose-2'-O)-methylase SpoU